MKHHTTVASTARRLAITSFLSSVFIAGTAYAGPGLTSKASPSSGTLSMPPSIWTPVTAPSFSVACETGISLVGAVTPDLSGYIMALVKEGRESNLQSALEEESPKTAAKMLKREANKSLLSLGWISPSGFALVGTGKKFLKELSSAMAGKTPDVNRAYEIASTTSFFPPQTSALITANNVLKAEGKSVAIATGFYVLGATSGQAPANQFLAVLCRNAAAVYYPPVGIVYTEGAGNMAQVRREFENSDLFSTEKLMNAIVLADEQAK